MKKPWLVVYSSLTGNTKMLAEAVLEALPAGSEIFSVEDAPMADDYEKVAIGYWADKGTADKKAMEYMNKVTNSKVFVFATLGAYPDSAHAQDVLNRGAALLGAGCTVLGKFICQGKLSEALMARAKARPADHPHAATPERMKRWADASTHPDEQDFVNVQKAIKEFI